MAPLLEPTLSQKTLRSLLALSPFASPLRRFPSLLFHALHGPCVVFFFLPPIPSCPCIPIPRFFHSSSGGAGWRRKVVRSDDFSDTDFSSCRWRRTRKLGVWWLVWENVDGFEAEIFFLSWNFKYFRWDEIEMKSMGKSKILGAKNIKKDR